MQPVTEVQEAIIQWDQDIRNETYGKKYLSKWVSNFYVFTFAIVADCQTGVQEKIEREKYTLHKHYLEKRQIIIFYNLSLFFPLNQIVELGLRENLRKRKNWEKPP